MIKNIAILLCFISVLSFKDSTAQITTFRHVFGGTGDDFGQDIEQTPDGGYIITGATGSFGYGQSDVYLLKIDSAGIYEWSRSYGGSNVDWGYDVEITADSGYVIAGYTNSFGAGGYDFYLVRTNSIGDTLWTKTYGGWDWDYCYSMDITSDNGYILTGETYSYGAGEKDVWLVKTDEFGDTLWTKTFGGILDDGAKSVKETFDGNLIICGYSSTFGNGDKDIYFIQTSPQGVIQNSKLFGTPEREEANDIIQIRDSSEYWIIGTSYTNGGSASKMYLLKIDTLGSLIWEGKKGGSQFDYGNSISKHYKTRWGTIVGKTATNNSDMLGYTFESGAWVINSSVFGGAMQEEANDVKLCKDNGLIICGNTSSFNLGYSDLLIIKTNDSLLTDSTTYLELADTNKVKYSITNIDTKKDNDIKLKLYPSPSFNKQITISSSVEITSIQISNMLGQKIYSRSPFSKEIKIQNLPSGLLNAVVKFKSKQKTISFVVY